MPPPELVTVKLVLEAAVPPGVVTVIVPVVAPAGTVAVIWVALLAVKVEAGAPWKATVVAPVKFVPVRMTEEPTGPDTGAKEVIVGADTTTVKVKLPVEVALPPGVVTEIVPLLAPAGTVAVIWVALSTVKAEAAVPWKDTAVAPVKFVPVRTTEVPTGPEAGAKEATVGAGAVTAKEVEEVPLPAGVVTLTVPVVAPAGTVAVIFVALLTVKAVAAVPWKATAVAPERAEPVRTTEVPTGPETGAIPVMAGAGVGVLPRPVDDPPPPPQAKVPMSARAGIQAERPIDGLRFLTA